MLKREDYKDGMYLQEMTLGDYDAYVEAMDGKTNRYVAVAISASLFNLDGSKVYADADAVLAGMGCVESLDVIKPRIMALNGLGVSSDDADKDKGDTDPNAGS